MNGDIPLRRHTRTVPLETTRLQRHFRASSRAQLPAIAEGITTETRADVHSSLLTGPGQEELRRGVPWIGLVGSVSMTTCAVVTGTAFTRHVHAGRGGVALVEPRVGITTRTSCSTNRQRGWLTVIGVTGRKSIGWED